VSGAHHQPILVVDDDEAILHSVEIILADDGFPVVLASNGQEALALLEAHHPRLVLLDMKMPVMDGWTFAAAYRGRPGPHAPIIVMTAGRDSARRAAEISAEAFIAKPFDIDDLIGLVRQYVLPE
jgi:two-component system, chemotaxis family, chemotaxis protein CheY